MSDSLPSPERMLERIQNLQRHCDQVWAKAEELALVYEEAYDQGLRAQAAGSLAPIRGDFAIVDIRGRK